MVVDRNGFLEKPPNCTLITDVDLPLYEKMLVWAAGQNAKILFYYLDEFAKANYALCFFQEDLTTSRRSQSRSRSKEASKIARI